MKVVLDAGHGYRFGGRRPTGAQGQGLVEDDVNLDMASRIGHLLRAAGHETVMTRPDLRVLSDIKALDLRRRVNVTLRSAADMFLSVHANAFRKPEGEGFEAIVVRGDLRSKQLADHIDNSVQAAMGRRLHSRGVKWDDQSAHKSLYVLRKTYRKMPAVLIEVAFLTNPADAQRLKDRYWRQEVAQAIVNGLVGGA